MRKPFFGLVLLIALAFTAAAFSGCNPDKPDAYAAFATYDNGTVTFHLKEKAEYDVYRSDSEDGPFTKVDTVNDSVYVTDDAYSYFSFRETGGESARAIKPFSYIKSSLGPNVKVFTPKDDQAEIRDYISTLYETSYWNEFGLDRDAIMFMPGDYGDVTVHVGFYTSVAGLGYSPEDVTVGGFETRESVIGTGSLINFWRTVENFSVDGTAAWCVSQATSMRRVNISGDLLLTTDTYGSGGFLSDSFVAGTIKADNPQGRDQQQWFTRNSTFGAFSGGQMNMVFVGTNGELRNLTDNRKVEVDTTGFLREKPFTVFDERKGYGVYLPDARYGADGNSWKDEDVGGTFIPLTDFYVARAEFDTAESLNAALGAGKNLLFSPGIYKLEAPLAVNNPDTVVTGLGLATLATTETNRDTAVRIADEDGINVSSLLIETGKQTETLMEVGAEKSDISHADNPICLADIFFRSGGSYDYGVSVDKTLVVNAGDVFGDNFWMWRADHSFTGNLREDTMRYYKDADGVWKMDGLKTADGADNWAWDGGLVGWNDSTGKTGVEINGDDVTMYGLMVEHYMEYQTIWNGERGFMCFYQSETPYDAQTQADWINDRNAGDYARGYASYKIGDHVQEHTAYGIGVYFVNNQGRPKFLSHGIEAPPNSGIKLTNMIINCISGTAGNGIAGVLYDGVKMHGAQAVNYQKQYLKSYEAGVSEGF